MVEKSSQILFMKKHVFSHQKASQCPSCSMDQLMIVLYIKKYWFHDHRSIRHICTVWLMNNDLVNIQTLFMNKHLFSHHETYPVPPAAAWTNTESPCFTGYASWWKFMTLEYLSMYSWTHVHHDWSLLRVQRFLLARTGSLMIFMTSAHILLCLHIINRSPMILDYMNPPSPDNVPSCPVS